MVVRTEAKTVAVGEAAKAARQTKRPPRVWQVSPPPPSGRSNQVVASRNVINLITVDDIKATQPQSSPGPKRLGLADLKRAFQERQAAKV